MLRHVVVVVAAALSVISSAAAAQQVSDRAKKYAVADLPSDADPRLSRAVSKLDGYEFVYGYFRKHLYLAVLRRGLSWEDSRKLAETAGGHLVTISDRAENTFARNLFVNDERFFQIAAGGTALLGPYIGLYQLPNSKEPRGGWRWVTEEPLAFVAWAGGEPNNQGIEDVGHFIQRSKGKTSAALWNDAMAGGATGLVIEVD